jgi:SCP-2 sterol transfer family protein
MEEDVFVGIYTGEVNGMEAFMGGQIVADGDMGLAMKLGEVLGACPACLTGCTPQHADLQAPRGRAPFASLNVLQARLRSPPVRANRVAPTCRTAFASSCGVGA